MTQSRTEAPIALDQQRRFWNSWNAKHRVGNRRIPKVNARQAQMVREWILRLGRTDLDILEVGCGSGWLCEQLVEFGRVTGTDLANEVLPSENSVPRGATFIAGDFFRLEFPSASFDVVVSLEMLAHVEDQSAFIAKIADLLRPGGHLILATQNRFVLERWSEVGPKGEGQVRQWVDARSLRRVLSRHFRIAVLTSIVPVGDRGILRWVNAYRVNRVLSAIMSQARLDGLKERLLLGHTLMVLAHRPARTVAA